MKTLILALVIFGLAVSMAQAQVSQEWVARYASPTSFSDIPYAMTVDAAGGIVVTGTGATAGSNDWATIKYSSSGVQEWLRSLDGGGNDAAAAIATDQAGNIYVTGSSAGGLYSMTAKYTAVGDRLWIQNFTTTGEGDAGVDVAVDHDGNVYVTGYNVETATGFDIVTIKYSPGGVELWVRRFGGSGDDSPAAIACDASGVYVTGSSNGDYTTIKYDFDGVQQWVRSYNGTGNGNDSPADLMVDTAGNIYVTGQSTGVGTNVDYATIKYDGSGDEQWARRYDGPATTLASDYDRAVALAVDASGNVFVTGNSSDDFATVKYDAAGTEVWVRRYSGPAAGADWATAVAVDGSGNSYVTGSSYGSSTTQYDFATLSYDPSGAVRWTERYNGPGNNYDTPYSIAVHSGDVYVTGSSTGSGTALDYTTIKYASTVTSVESGSPRGTFALKSDPNPFTTPATRVSFTIPGTKSEHVRLAVYDVNGREVALLVNEALSPGTHERVLNGSTLAAGVYWSRLEVGTHFETRKIIRMK